jgi:hypothetical protein
MGSQFIFHGHQYKIVDTISHFGEPFIRYVNPRTRFTSQLPSLVPVYPVSQDRPSILESGVDV